MAKRRRRVWLGLAIGLIGALIPLAVVYACTPNAVVTASVSSAAPGSQVTVTVERLYGDADVQLSLATFDKTFSDPLWSGVSPPVPANMESSVTVTVTVPSWAPGKYYLMATIPNPTNPSKPYQPQAVLQITAPSPGASGQSGTEPVTDQSPSGAVSSGVNSMVDSSSEAVAAGPPSASAASAPSLTGPALDLQSRVIARDGNVATLGSGSGQNAEQPAQVPVFSTQDTSPSNPAMTGLAIGAMTLAIGLPLVFAGFATAGVVQRRAARAGARKPEK